MCTGTGLNVNETIRSQSSDLKFPITFPNVSAGWTVAHRFTDLGAGTNPSITGGKKIPDFRCFKYWYPIF